MDLVDQSSTTSLLKYLEFKKYFDPKRSRIFEFAAGIGRATKNLCNWCDSIDVLEPYENFSNEIEKMKLSMPKIANIYKNTVEDFEFEFGKKYDMLFAGWLLGNLTDMEILKFLKKYKSTLTPNGIFIIKDNFADSNTFKIWAKD